MGQAIPYAIRVKIIERRKAGHSYKAIAADLGRSESGVKKFWYRYQKQGNAALKTNYSNCGGHSIYKEEIRAHVKRIRNNEQGAAYVRSKLVLQSPDLVLPSERTLQRWWQKAETSRSPGRPRVEEKKMD